MKYTFLKWHQKYGWLYLIPWVLMGFVGSYQFTDAYIGKKTEGIEPPGSIFALIAYSPIPNLIINVFLALFSLGILGFFYWILKKRFSLKFKCFIFIFPASFILLTAYLAIRDFIESVTWSLYISALQDFTWLVFLMFIVQIYWKEIKNNRENVE